jgi:hypothetical protein
MTDPLTTLRAAANGYYRRRDARAALAAVEQLVQAARGITECGDYWDWVTHYSPALKDALAPFEPKQDVT